ncbi:Nuclear valosin-containing protein-like [Trichinella spiralis]|uniref:Nuclear valosin-containing protein-like n=1 Tax=Trichinella spiralis TaxID=6334 RepID=A0A0V1BWM5_TRISP|nr:Nuclear valosin-containing protein-like [Trichinella spiralis]
MNRKNYSRSPRNNKKFNKESESEISDNPNFNMMNSRLSNFYKTNSASLANANMPLNIDSNQKNFNQHSSKGKYARKRKLREDKKRNSPEMSDNFNVFEDMIEIKRPRITFHDIGGCEHQLTEVCKFMFHMMHPEVYEKLGIRPPRGFLLYGPPGCGKTLLAHAIAGEFELPLIKITATEIVSGISGDSEKKIRNLFTKAILTAPCILFIDEIDSITPRRDVAQRDMDRRIVSQLLACIDDLENSDNHVLFIGATNRVESMDPALRMAGRFDREIAFGMPDELSRIKILEVVCRGVNLSGCFDFGHLARLCPGFVGADLKALVREACICSIKRVFTSVLNDGQSCVDDCTIVSDSSKLPSNVSTAGSSWNINSELKNRTIIVDWLKSGRQCSESALSNLSVKMEDFELALKHIQPSAKREGFATVPDVTWNDVGALDSVREELQWSILVREIFLYPIKWNREFSLMGLGGRAQGILLFGPPGCGKTLLAKAIANESGINFISVKGPELLNMYVGESERAVRQVFQRAKCSAPCVIFFDEIDALCPRRAQSDSSGVARLVNQLLTEMDGIECRREVFIMAATNRPDIIDPAVLRPGRLDKALYVGLPNEEDRVSILRAITKNGTTPPMHEEIDFKQLSNDKRCEAFSGADLQHLVREASVEALREYFIIQNDHTEKDKAVPELLVRLKHFDMALSKVKPSISVKSRLVKKGVNPKINTINWICDKENGYTLKCLLYTGRSGLASTNHVRVKQHDVIFYSTLAVYENNKKVTMINYVPRKNSNNVLLLTSCHAKFKIDNQRDDKRSNITNDYTLYKGGVDSMDARIEDFCCKRKTNRYTMLMLYFIVELARQHIEMRYQNQKSMQKLNMPSSAKDCPKIINVTNISYKTTKSIKMLSARTSKINVKPLLFM